MPPPCTPPSTTPSPARASTAEKRGKESSDEDGGSDKGSGQEDGGKKACALDGSSGEDEYRQLRSKRQKLKEKKRRQKAKKAEAALRPSPLLLSDDTERERLWILDSLHPSPEAIDQALAGHPATHPQLLRLLMTADSLSTACVQPGIDPSLVRPVLRHLVLSHSSLTHEAYVTAVTHHLHTL
jgi:hypothetical protein